MPKTSGAINSREDENIPVVYDHQVSSTSEDSQPIDVDSIAAEVSMTQYASLFIFTTLVFMCLLSQYTLMSQYIYYRFADEQHMPDAGLNKNVSVCSPVNETSDPYDELRNHVQALTSEFNMFNSLITGIPAVFSTIVLGVYSDRIGRKYSLVISWLGMSTSYGIWVLWMCFKLPMWLYTLGGLASALAGSMGFFLASLFAFISDSTSGSQRSFGIAALDACFGISGLVSMTLTGYLIRWFGFTYSFYGVFALMFFSGIFIIPLPETSVLAQQRSENSSSKLKTESKGSLLEDDTSGANLQTEMSKNPITMFQWSAKVFMTDKQRGILLGLLLLSLFMFTWSYFGDITISTLFKLNKPLCWNSVKISNYGAVKIVLSQFLALLMIGGLRKLLHENWLVVLGFASLIGSQVILSVVPLMDESLANIIMYLTLVVGTFNGLCLPLLRSIMSKLVTKYEQGVIFGVVGSLESLANMLGNMATSGIYEGTVAFYSGLAYAVDAGFVFVGLVIFGIFVFLKNRGASKMKSDTETSLFIE